MLAAALYLAGTGPRVAALGEQVRRQRTPAGGHRASAADIAEVLGRHRRHGEPLEAAPLHLARARIARGWDPDDPLLGLSLAALARQAGAGRITPGHLPALRPLITRAGPRPWLNPGWLNVVATVIIVTLLMLSGTLMATTLFPHIDATKIATWLSIALAAGLAAAVIALRGQDPPRHPRARAPAPPVPRELRSSWRMPPRALLKPVTCSPALKLGMLALRGYLLVAALLLVKAIQLGTH